jgi:hypothetical protein
VAIIYPLALPATNRFRQVLWREVDVTADVASPFTGQSQVIVFPGQWFECTLTLVAMVRAQAQAWDAWITSLKGHAGTFLLGHPLRAAPLGSAAVLPGTPLVKGADQSGDVLAIDGCPANAASYLKAGDHIGLGSGAGSRLYKVLEDVATDPLGNASVSVWPNLRASPADNAPVVVANAKGLFHRMSPVTDWTVGPDGTTQQRSFDCKERLS